MVDLAQEQFEKLSRKKQRVHRCRNADPFSAERHTLIPRVAPACNLLFLPDFGNAKTLIFLIFVLEGGTKIIT
jgi:hypothetical protein